MAGYNLGSERKSKWIFQFGRSSLRFKLFFLIQFSIFWGNNLHQSSYTSSPDSHWLCDFMNSYNGHDNFQGGSLHCSLNIGLII